MSIADTLREYDDRQAEANGHYVEDAILYLTTGGVIRGHVAVDDDGSTVTVNQRRYSNMGGSTAANPLTTIVSDYNDAGTEDYPVTVSIAHIVMVSPVGAAERKEV